MSSCGSHVGIRQDEQGCYLLSVDGIAYRICPGSQVSCDPNGLGIMIDGVLCPFPRGNGGEGSVVKNAGGVSAMRRMTQAAYDALPVKDPDTFYVIVG